MNAIRNYAETTASYAITTIAIASPWLLSRSVRWLINVQKASTIRIWNGIDLCMMGFVFTSCCTPLLISVNNETRTTPTSNINLAKRMIVRGLFVLSVLMIIKGFLNIMLTFFPLDSDRSLPPVNIAQRHSNETYRDLTLSI